MTEAVQPLPPTTEQRQAIQVQYEDVPFPDGGGIAFQIDRQRGIVRIVRKHNGTSKEYFFDVALRLHCVNGIVR